MDNKGIALVLATAFISGFSIFLNAIAVKEFNPVLFSGIKNLVVGLLLVSAIILLKEYATVRKLTFKQWKLLFAVGLIGGSIPFMLWFSALKMAGSALALGFIHKTMFAFVVLLAFFFLKERMDAKMIFAALLLMAGNFFLFSGMQAFGIAEIMGLAAVLFWAAETVLSKKLLESIPSNVVAGSRMFFGSLIILAYLAVTSQLDGVFRFAPENWFWIAITSALLFGYVATYYAGLKLIPATVASSILLLGQPVTAMLSLLFLGKAITPSQAIGLVLVLSGIIAMIGFLYYASGTKRGSSLTAFRKA